MGGHLVDIFSPRASRSRSLKVVVVVLLLLLLLFLVVVVVVVLETLYKTFQKLEI